MARRDKLHPFVFMLFFLNWIFGTMTIECPIGQPWPRLSVVYTLAGVAVHWYAGYWSFIQIEEFNIWVLNSNYLFDIVFVALLLLISHLLTRPHGKFLRKFCTASAEEIDKEFDKLGAPINHRNLNRFNLVNFAISCMVSNLLLTVSSAIKFIRDAGELVPRLIYVLFFHYAPMVQYALDAGFYYVVSNLLYRMKRVNLTVDSMLTQGSESWVKRELNSSTLKEFRWLVNDQFTVKRLKIIHRMIGCQCQDTDTAYGPYILWTFILCTFVTARVFYNTIILIEDFALDFEFSLKVMIIGGLLISIQVYKAWVICDICSKMTLEAIKTGDSLAKLYDEPATNLLTKAEIRDFYIQMLRDPVEFSAWGFLTVDLALFKMMIGIIIASVVLLLQLNRTSCPA